MGSNVISFSGGKDSTAMLVKMIEDGEDIADIVYFNGGWDFPQMHEHLEKVEEYIGRKITHLRPMKSFTQMAVSHKVRARDGTVKRCGYGWPGQLRRWCTRIKQTVLETHTKSLAYRNPLPIVQCIGFACDEVNRVERRRPKDSSVLIDRFPLVEWNMTEAEALAFCRNRGFDWGGLYDVFDRVSCFCCPLGGKRQVWRIRDNYPELMHRMLELEESMPEGKYRGFTRGMRVSELINVKKEAAHA